MHADDILMLATTRLLAIEKLKCLMEYSKENYIKLQILKCAMMCVNSEDPIDKEAIEVNDVKLESTESEVKT